MPRVGMEPIRRAALVKATIAEIGAAGSLDVTVAGIARRAGVSPALAHHYFGTKDDILEAAMRTLLTEYRDAVRHALRGQSDPRVRLTAIVRASFAAPNFTAEAISAWLNFYVLAQSDTAAARLLAIYQRRLVSNLAHCLRPSLGTGAVQASEALASLIDGIYLRRALQAPCEIDPATSVLAFAECLCAQDAQPNFQNSGEGNDTAERPT
ncbi:MAG: transcriptional regulator BetI [Pseudomonadota bacterium]